MEWARSCSIPMHHNQFVDSTWTIKLAADFFKPTMKPTLQFNSPRNWQNQFLGFIETNAKWVTPHAPLIWQTKNITMESIMQFNSPRNWHNKNPKTSRLMKLYNFPSNFTLIFYIQHLLPLEFCHLNLSSSFEFGKHPLPKNRDGNYTRPNQNKGNWENHNYPNFRSYYWDPMLACKNIMFEEVKRVQPTSLSLFMKRNKVSNFIFGLCCWS
jgi:hypothetical protein